MKTVIEVLKLAASYLEERKIERSRRVSEELLSHILKMKRIDLYLQYDLLIEEKELTQLREALRRAAKNEPFEYINGEISFCGCSIRVDRRVLIPRPETEILIDHISKKGDFQNKIIWDLCTGSGCIGIVLKKLFPSAEVTLSDLSSDALALAEENAGLNGVSVSFLQGDFLSPFQGKSADLIVCNPPYISTTEYFSLDSSVRDFEPKQALLGGEDGLSFYQRLEREVFSFLRPQGSLFLEIGHGQGERVNKIFDSPLWKNRTLIQDWSGKDRFFSLEK